MAAPCMIKTVFGVTFVLSQSHLLPQRPPNHPGMTTLVLCQSRMKRDAQMVELGVHCKRMWGTDVVIPVPLELLGPFHTVRRRSRNVRKGAHREVDLHQKCIKQMKRWPGVSFPAFEMYVYEVWDHHPCLNAKTWVNLRREKGQDALEARSDSRIDDVDMARETLR